MKNKIKRILKIRKYRLVSHPSTPSVFLSVNFVFLDILTKPKACMIHSSSILFKAILTTGLEDMQEFLRVKAKKMGNSF